MTITKLTGAQGIADFTYQSGTTPGTITFTASSGSASAINQLLTVSFGPTTQILCSADTSVITPNENGSSSVEVAALVSDENGTAVVEGVLVAFEVIAGGTFGQITPWSTTNPEGVAVATLTFLLGNSGSTITVRATVGTVSKTLVITLPVASNSDDVANLLPFSYNTAVATDSLVTWEISTVATDSLANPVTSVEIRWDASPDSLGSIITNTTTNSNGTATTTLVYHERYGGTSIIITARSGSAIRTETLILPTP